MTTFAVSVSATTGYGTGAYGYGPYGKGTATTAVPSESIALVRAVTLRGTGDASMSVGRVVTTTIVPATASALAATQGLLWLMPLVVTSTAQSSLVITILLALSALTGASITMGKTFFRLLRFTAPGVALLSILRIPYSGPTPLDLASRYGVRPAYLPWRSFLRGRR